MNSCKCGLNIIRKVLSNLEETVRVTLFWGGLLCLQACSLSQLILFTWTVTLFWGGLSALVCHNCVLLYKQLHPAGRLPDCEHDACSGCELRVHTAELPIWTAPEHAHSGTDPGVCWGGKTGGRWTQGGPRNCKSHPHPPTTSTLHYTTTVTASLSCDFLSAYILYMITYCKYDFGIQLFFQRP